MRLARPGNGITPTPARPHTSTATHDAAHPTQPGHQPAPSATPKPCTPASAAAPEGRYTGLDAGLSTRRRRRLSDSSTPSPRYSTVIVYGTAIPAMASTRPAATRAGTGHPWALATRAVSRPSPPASAA